eukprot:scaffold281709_cov31-Tisochrysis_lutea.AAC.1
MSDELQIQIHILLDHKHRRHTIHNPIITSTRGHTLVAIESQHDGGLNFCNLICQRLSTTSSSSQQAGGWRLDLATWPEPTDLLELAPIGDWTIGLGRTGRALERLARGAMGEGHQLEWVKHPSPPPTVVSERAHNVLPRKGGGEEEGLRRVALTAQGSGIKCPPNLSWLVAWLVPPTFLSPLCPLPPLARRPRGVARVRAPHRWVAAVTLSTPLTPLSPSSPHTVYYGFCCERKGVGAGPLAAVSLSLSSTLLSLSPTLRA